MEIAAGFFLELAGAGLIANGFFVTGISLISAGMFLIFSGVNK
ncbi:MAG TPA: hypothetical protein VEP90_02945 [Methylomirabilota bacterium]|nr:hypothetical protein [Methylomirabilota bacterium]